MASSQNHFNVRATSNHIELNHVGEPELNHVGEPELNHVREFEFNHVGERRKPEKLEKPKKPEKLEPKRPEKFGVPEKPEKLDGLLKFAVEKQVQQLVSRKFHFSYLNMDPTYLDAKTEYERLLKYLDKLPEPHKTYLTALVFPVFVHLYLLILQNADDDTQGAKQADLFFKEFCYVFLAAQGYENILKRLNNIKNCSDVKKDDYFSKYWKMKYIIKAPDASLHILNEFLEEIDSKALLYVLHLYFYYEGQDMPIPVEEEESKCVGARKVSRHILSSSDTDFSSILPTYISCDFSRYSSADINDKGTEMCVVSCDDEQSDIHIIGLFKPFRTTKVKLPNVTAVKYVPGSIGPAFLASQFNNVLLIHSITGETLTKYHPNHVEKIWSIDVSRSGAFFATASEDFTVSIWNTTEKVAIKHFSANSDAVTVVKFHPNGFYFAAGSAHGALFLWTVEKTVPLRSFVGHSVKIISLAFSPNGKLLASSDSIGNVKIWNIEKCAEIFEVADGKPPVTQFCFNDSSTEFGICDGSGNLRVWYMRYEKKFFAEEIINENYFTSPIVMKFTGRRQWKMVFNENSSD